jgi:hypothetical protein
LIPFFQEETNLYITFPSFVDLQNNQDHFSKGHDGTSQTYLEEMSWVSTSHIYNRRVLANKPKTSIEWSNLHEHLGAVLESDLPSIKKVIGSSFDGLPYYLKQIFLYLSIFPENNDEIKHTRLIRWWMAEGYITNNQNMPVEDVGERYYNQLINRSMIQGSKANRVVGAGRCSVHSMVLQVILSLRRTNYSASRSPSMTFHKVRYDTWWYLDGRGGMRSCIELICHISDH